MTTNRRIAGPGPFVATLDSVVGKKCVVIRREVNFEPVATVWIGDSLVFDIRFNPRHSQFAADLDALCTTLIGFNATPEQSQAALTAFVNEENKKWQ
jgi:hypothetical protein